MSESDKPPVATIPLRIQFGGGLELLFSNQRDYRIDVPAFVPISNDTRLDYAAPGEQKPADITYLIHYLRDHLLKERVELFMEEGTVCVSPSRCLSATNGCYDADVPEYLC